MKKWLEVIAAFQYNMDVDNRRENAANLLEELLAGGRKAVDVPVEQKHQVLEHFKSN